MLDTTLNVTNRDTRSSNSTYSPGRISTSRHRGQFPEGVFSMDVVEVDFTFRIVGRLPL